MRFLRARGKTTLEKVLEILSKGKRSIAQIAREARLPAQAVNVSLIRLAEVDLVERIGGEYQIVDPLLGFWINSILLHGEEFVKIKAARMRQLEQELLKTKTELAHLEARLYQKSRVACKKEWRGASL